MRLQIPDKKVMDKSKGGKSLDGGFLRELIKIDGNVLSSKQAKLTDTGKIYEIRFIFMWKPAVLFQSSREY